MPVTAVGSPLDTDTMRQCTAPPHPSAADTAIVTGQRDRRDAIRVRGYRLIATSIPDRRLVFSTMLGEETSRPIQRRRRRWSSPPSLAVRVGAPSRLTE